MIIVIRNIASGKIALYLNRYLSVVVSVWHLLQDPSVGIEGHHLYPLISFFQFLQASGYSISLEKRFPIAYVQSIFAVFSHDLSLDSISAVKAVLSAQPSAKLVLLLSEHPTYQRRLFSPLVLDLFDAVYTSMDVAHPSIVNIFSSFIFRQIPQIHHFDGFSYRQACDVALVSSNLPNRRDTTYGLRRHMINVLTEIDSLSFAFYGRGWRLSDYSSDLRLLAKYSFSNLSHSTRLTSRALSRYGGEILSKKLLLSAKSSLSIENSLSPNGYITEKLIEPLVYGSIPIYMGPLTSTAIRQILPSTLLRFFEHYDAPSLVRTCLEVSDMNLNQSKSLSQSIRSVINSYLEANGYPTGLWKIAKVIGDHLS